MRHNNTDDADNTDDDDKDNDNNNDNNNNDNNNNKDNNNNYNNDNNNNNNNKNNNNNNKNNNNITIISVRVISIDKLLEERERGVEFLLSFPHHFITYPLGTLTMAAFCASLYFRRSTAIVFPTFKKSK